MLSPQNQRRAPQMPPPPHPWSGGGAIIAFDDLPLCGDALNLPASPLTSNGYSGPFSASFLGLGRLWASLTSLWSFFSGPLWACPLSASLSLSGPLTAFLGVSGPLWACLGLGLSGLSGSLLSPSLSLLNQER